ncbi:hypothetical protein EXIGLDRAFT_390564 [Exidia glandulosa HHB12029]|uniref:Uncharacterized protein n=1 Tax=Exidia glandulosa HHB12029 TaxID=1314781 RepID=A0A165KZ97_EXIGL|nr:hypothetical protein EXIGLDRAFT_390564 [Exidia glandulosa HHB12029]
MAQCQTLFTAFAPASTSLSSQLACPRSTEGVLTAPLSFADVVRCLYLEHTCHPARLSVEASGFIYAAFCLLRPLLRSTMQRRVHVTCTTALLAVFMALAFRSPGAFSVEAGMWFRDAFSFSDIMITIVLALLAGRGKTRNSALIRQDVDVFFRLTSIETVHVLGVLLLSALARGQDTARTAACLESSKYGAGGYLTHLLLRWTVLHPRVQTWAAYRKSVWSPYDRILRMGPVSINPCQTSLFAFGALFYFSAQSFFFLTQFGFPIPFSIVMATVANGVTQLPLPCFFSQSNWMPHFFFGTSCMMLLTLPFVLFSTAHLIAHLVGQKVS